MSFNHTLSAVLRGRWLINKEWAEAHLPLVLSMLKGNPVSFVQPEKTHRKNAVERTGDEAFEMAFAVDPKTMQRHDYYVWSRQRGWVPNPNIPENSVGVVPITGPVTKYNGACGEAGAIKNASLITEMGKRSNIGSIMLLLDTPGGEARASSAYTTAIEGVKKPVLSFIDGMAASLGIYPMVASDEAYFSNSSDEAGSVGSYITLLDFRGYLEKEGVKMHEIYAPQSEDKNKDYRDALQGNYDGLKADLKMHVDSFIKYVKDQRGDKAASKVDQWGTGKMFYAEDAVKVGLADGIKTFEQVVSKAAWLAHRNN